MPEAGATAGAAADSPAAQAAAEFLERDLGPGSSHPRWRRRRRLIAGRITIALVALVVVSAVALVALADDLIETALNLLELVRWVGPGFAAALAFSVTLSLSDRVADLRARSGVSLTATEGSRRLEARFADWRIVALFTVVGVAVPIVASSMPELSFKTRLLAGLFATLPLLGLEFGIAALEARERGRSVAGRPLLALLFLLAIGAFLYASVMSVRRYLEDIPFADRILEFLGAIPLLIIAFALFRAFPQVSAARKKSEDKGPSWLSRLVSWLFEKLGGGTPEPPAEEPEPPAEPTTPPAWLAAILGELPAGCTLSSDEPFQYKAPSPAPPSRRDDLRPLFLGHDPTVDQAACMTRFDEAYQEAVDGTSSRSETPSASLLLVGPAGSGRTATLVAMAVHAAFVRGQRVLFVVPDGLRVESIRQLVTEFARSARLLPYVSISVMKDDIARPWIDALVQEKPVAASIPDILVTTAEELEQQLYGVRLVRAEQSEALATLLRLFDVMLIDDVLDFGDAQRSHLPFQVAKHHLVLATEQVTLQAVTVAPPLAEVGRGLFAERLLPIHRERNVLQLRLREGAPVWRVDIEADDVKAAVEALAVQCAAATPTDVEVVLYRRGVDEATRLTQEAALQERAGANRLRVVANLDSPLIGAGTVDAVVYEIAATDDACLSLSARFGHDRTVCFAIRGKGTIFPTVSDVVPVIAARSAPPLLIAHLQSALRVLRSRMPIRETVWRDFGVDPTAAIAERPAPGAVHIDWDSVSEDEVYADGAVWPALGLREPHVVWAPVEVRELPRTGQKLVSVPGSMVLSLSGSARPAVGDFAVRYSEWRFGAGADPRTVDLLHTSDLRQAVGTDAFAPESVDRAGDGRVLVAATHFQGDGSDFTHPAWEHGFLCEPTALGGRGGGYDLGLSWLDVAREAEVTTSLVGRLSAAGALAPLAAIPLAHHATISALLLAPRANDPNRLAEIEARCLRGEWTTASPRYRPALTAALAFAVESRLPGFHVFGRLAAFSLAGPRSLLGDFAVFVLQPSTGGRTAMPVVARLLSSPTERKAFLETAIAALEAAKTATDPRATLSALARGDTGLQVGLENLDDIVTFLKSLQVPRARPAAGSEPPGPQGGTEPKESPPGTYLPGQKTPWPDVAAALHRDAIRVFAAFDDIVAAGFDHTIIYRLTLSAGTNMGPLLQGLKRHRDLAGTLTGPMLDISPAAGSTCGAAHVAFTDWLLGCLATQPLPVGSPVTLLLWVVRKRDLNGRWTPHFDDAVTSILEGGFHPDGLLRQSAGRAPLSPDSPPASRTDLLFEPVAYPRPDTATLLSSEWEEPLPPAPVLGGASGSPLAFEFHGKSAEVCLGFAEADAHRRYFDVLDGLARRPNHDLSEVLLNDPYLDAVAEVGTALLASWGAAPDSEFADFLLAFVQSIPYLTDPERVGTDWPRYPSEYFLNRGGDCEDSSMAYLALLSQVGAHAAIVRTPSHASVGVVGPYGGTYFEHDGARYYAAETALDGGYRPIGKGDADVARAEVLPHPGRRLPKARRVAVLGVQYHVGAPGAPARISFVLTARTGSPSLRVAVFRRYAEHPHAKGDLSLAGAVDLAPHARDRAVIRGDIDLEPSQTRGTCFLDVVVFAGTEIVGRLSTAISLTSV